MCKLNLYHIFIFILLMYVPNFSSADTENSIEILNPIFTTKGINENQYEIKAKKGIQKGDHLYLEKIEGKLKTNDNIWIYLTADEGNFDQVDGVINLSSNIEVYTDNNEKIYSDYALIETEINKITLDNNVKFQNNLGLITADKSIIKNDFSEVSYLGNVNTLITIRD